MAGQGPEPGDAQLVPRKANPAHLHGLAMPAFSCKDTSNTGKTVPGPNNSRKTRVIISKKKATFHARPSPLPTYFFNRQRVLVSVASAPPFGFSFMPTPRAFWIRTISVQGKRAKTSALAASRMRIPSGGVERFEKS